MSGNLTEEQLRRIEENRKKALARRAEKQGRPSPQKINKVSNRSTVSGTATSISKENGCRSFTTKPVNKNPMQTGSLISLGISAKSNSNVSEGNNNRPESHGISTEAAICNVGNKQHIPVNTSNSGQSGSAKIHVEIAPRTELSSASSNSAIPSGSSLSNATITNPFGETKTKEMTVQERIEENRRKALEKLAEKKKSPVKNGPSAFASQNSGAKLSAISCVNKANNMNKTGQTGQPVSCGIQPVKASSSSSFLNSFNKASADALNHKSSSTNQTPLSVSHGGTEAVATSKNMFASFSGKTLKGSCVLISRDRFEVDIGFSAPLVQFFKTMDTKLYDAMTKKWSFKLSEYNRFMAAVKGLQPAVEIEPLPKAILQVFNPANRGDNQLLTAPIADLSNVEPTLVNSLMYFQREGVNFGIWKNGRVLIADDMGLGKTIQAICLACYYRQEWPLLIVVPSSVRFDWAQQFQRWVPSLDPHQISVAVTGKDSCSSGLVNILSYDLMARKGTELRQKRFNIIIMDECHLLKNYKTARCKAAMPLLQNSRRVILLSGTPALSRPSELYTQICAVCPFLFKFHDFGVRYCDGKQHPWGWDYSGSSNMAELQLLLEEKIMIRRLKKDVLTQLPDKVRQMVLLDPRSIKVDKDLKRASKVMNCSNLKGMEQRGALLEFFHQSGKAKLDAVKTYVEDLLEGDRKFIIFAHHQEVLDGIEAVVKKKIDSGYIRIDGRTNSEQRNYFCKKFQNNDDISVAILSITAANAGLNLSAATLVVFAELFWNPGILVQAEDRAHRIGQQDSVSVHYLVATGTSDDHIWPMIQKKLDVLGKAGLTKDDFSSADTTRVKDPRQEEIIKFLEESFSEDLPAADPIYDGTEAEESDGCSGEGGSKRNSKTGKQMSILEYCSPVKDLPQTGNPMLDTPPKPAGLFKYFSPTKKNNESDMVSEDKGEGSEFNTNCDNELDMFLKDDDDDLFDEFIEPQQKKQRT